MVHYHGGPITPNTAAIQAWKSRHAFISFANPEQLPLAAEVCQSFALDNGAFSIWKAGEGSVDCDAYKAWLKEWFHHPGFDWFLIPDVINGDEKTNDAKICEFSGHWPYGKRAVPVWHLHESINRLKRLATSFDRVALGSSGEWSEPGTQKWWARMGQAMDAICDGAGRPVCKLHGLRMLDPTVFSHLPLASADSCNIARNIGIDSAWTGSYAAGMSKETRAAVLRDRIESHCSAAQWNREASGVQMNMQLIG